MPIETWQYSSWLAQHRAAFAHEPAATVIPFVRALNTVALDTFPTSGPNLLFDEAFHALSKVIDEDGATPARVYHFIMILINDAQANAFSGGPAWPDLGRALDAAAGAVEWHVQLAAHIHSLEDGASSGPRRFVQSTAINAYLTLARVQAACALMTDARTSYTLGLEHLTSTDLQREWGEIVMSVSDELGQCLPTAVNPSEKLNRTECWFWYGGTV